MMVYLLGWGSWATAMSKQSWDAWTRPYFEFNGVRYIGSHAPLFVHQDFHAWFDFRGKRDKYAGYLKNLIVATKVQKLWCLELARDVPDSKEDFWGFTGFGSG